MNRTRHHPNFEICDAVVKRQDGVFTVRDMEQAEGLIPWREAPPSINAKPERMKICPICIKRQSIAEFLNYDAPLLRTVARLDFSFVCAEIFEYCRTCWLDCKEASTGYYKLDPFAETDS